MYIHFGKRLYGTCDVVPELFYVATFFFQIDLVPLVPLSSHVILGQAGKTYHTVPIPLSAKSIVYAWARVGTFVVALSSIVIAIALGVNFKPGLDDFPWPTIMVAVVASAAFVALMVLPRRRMPSYERACELARLAQLNERGWAALNVLYGHDPLENTPSPAVPAHSRSRL